MAALFTHRFLILCEGSHDTAFFGKIIREHNIPDYQVLCPKDTQTGGGNTRFTDALNGYIPDTGFPKVESILIVADSDTDPAQSFINIQNSINGTVPLDFYGNRYPIPIQPLQKAAGSPSVCVMMIPWINEHGCLETLLLSAIDPVIWAQPLSCADQFLTCTGADGWNISKRDKVRIRSVIAGSYRRNPDLPLHKIWKEIPNLVSLRHASFNDIINFLRQFPTMPAI